MTFRSLRTIQIEPDIGIQKQSVLGSKVVVPYIYHFIHRLRHPLVSLELPGQVFREPLGQIFAVL